MSEYHTIILLLVSFYTPLLLSTSFLSKSLVFQRKLDARKKNASIIKPKYFLFIGMGIIWLFAGLASLSIYLDGKGHYYLSRVVGGTRLVNYNLLLGVLIGIGLYYVVSEIYIPYLTRHLGKYAYLGSVKNKDWSEFLKPFTSNGVLLFMIPTNFMEEFVWRGFYITAFHNWSGSLVLAVIISSIIYGSYHFTFGIRDGFINGHNGLVYAILFVITRDLTLPFAAHVAYNLIAVLHIRKMFANLRAAQVSKQAAYKRMPY